MLTLGSNANAGDEYYPGHEVDTVYLSDGARKQGTYVIGTTGTGKTTFLLNLIAQDMARVGPMGKEGICVLDPHGDFTTDILRRVPRDRWDDVVLFDPSDIEFPLGLNLFDCNKADPRERDLVVSTVIDTLYRIFAYSWGPRMEDLLRHSILSLLYHPQPVTLIHLMLLLVSRSHRYRLTKVAKEHDPVLKTYWDDEFPEVEGKAKSREERELVGSSLNKIGRFVANPIIRHIVGQPYSSFSFREIMDEGKILIVNLSKGDIGADNSRFLGAVLVNQLLIAALSRRDIPEDQRRPFHLYVDEYQNFATATFPDLQSEARKYGIDTLVAHQYRDQLDDENKGSTLNVANLIVFRVSGRDAISLATQFDATPSPGEVSFRPIYDPVDEDRRLWIKRPLPSTGRDLHEMIEGNEQPYGDVHLEMANLMAQLPNYQAICRVLTPKERPRTLHQFRLDLHDKPQVSQAVGDEAEAHIRAWTREQYCQHTREEVAGLIEETMRDEEGKIPLY